MTFPIHKIYKTTIFEVMVSTCSKNDSAKLVKTHKSHNTTISGMWIIGDLWVGRWSPPGFWSRVISM